MKLIIVHFRPVSGYVTVVSPTKTVEPMEMPFWLMTRMGLRNRVLDGVQVIPWEWAILRRGKGGLS